MNTRYINNIIWILMIIVVFPLVYSCFDNTLNPDDHNEIRTIKLQNTPVQSIEPGFAGEMHGNIVVSFNKAIMKKAHCRPELKNKLVNNQGLDMSIFSSVLTQIINSEFKAKGINIGISEKDINLFLLILLQDLRETGMYDFKNPNNCEIESLFDYFYNNNIFSTDVIQRHRSNIIKLKYSEEMYLDNHIQIDYMPSKIEPLETDISEVIYNEICNNSKQVWIGSIEGDWIDDPELRGWWEEWWKKKGRTIAGILTDCIGGIVFTGISYGNPYAGMIGAALASVAFFWLVP